MSKMNALLNPQLHMGVAMIFLLQNDLYAEAADVYCIHSHDSPLLQICSEEHSQ